MQPADQDFDDTYFPPCTSPPPNATDLPWLNSLRQALTQWDGAKRQWAVDFTRGDWLVTINPASNAIRLSVINEAALAPVAILAQAVDHLSRSAGEVRWSIDWDYSTIRGVKSLPLNTHRDRIIDWTDHLMESASAVPLLPTTVVSRWCEERIGATYRRLAQYEAAIHEMIDAIVRRARPDGHAAKLSTRFGDRFGVCVSRSKTIGTYTRKAVVQAYVQDIITPTETGRLIALFELEREALDFLRWHGAKDASDDLDQQLTLLDNDFDDIHEEVRGIFCQGMLANYRSKIDAQVPPADQETKPLRRVALVDVPAPLTSPVAPSAEKKADPAADPAQWTPTRILKVISAQVVGQEAASRAMALEIHLHLQQVQRRGSLLLVGPTGCGKSMLAEVVAELVKVPFIHVNAAALVPEGIVGNNLTDACIAAINRAGGDVAVAERAIIMFDEVDKLTSAASTSPGKDPHYGTDVLHQLLRFVDGCTWPIDEYKARNKRNFPTELSTRKMLILFAGAWTAQRAQDVASAIGFAAGSETAKPEGAEADDLSVDDLGLPLELVGRISKVVNLRALTQNQLVHLLQQGVTPPLREVRERLTKVGSQLTLSPDLMVELARTAVEHGTGARGLVPLVRAVVDPLYWRDDLPGKNFHVEADRTLVVTASSLPAPATVTPTPVTGPVVEAACAS